MNFNSVQCYVDGDTSALHTIAHSLHQIQTLFGLFQNVKCKGAASKKVLQKMIQLRSVATGNTPSLNLSSGSNATISMSTAQHIDTLVMLDRFGQRFRVYLFNICVEKWIWLRCSQLLSHTRDSSMN